jgi:hypothetical protein
MMGTSRGSVQLVSRTTTAVDGPSVAIAVVGAQPVFAMPTATTNTEGSTQRVMILLLAPPSAATSNEVAKKMNFVIHLRI